jgi:pyruvate/2-oxoglutarate dehydrogenase complex dihydrolipoamide dehydrogenase (E3) component
MDYDIIVLGAGSAGLNIAGFMNSIGLRVLMVEKGIVGGDCLNYGCVPSKALISMAQTVHAARRAEAFGLHLVGNLELKKVADTIRARQEVIRKHENADYFRAKGIDVELGSPEFTGPRSIRINDREVGARKIVIATGSRPAVPKIEGIDAVDYFTNETIFKNRELPKQLLVIGGGPIGVEIGQAYRRLGSDVTIITRGQHILPKEDNDVASILTSVLKAEGIDILTAHTPIRFSKGNNLVIRRYDRQRGINIGEEELLPFDQILVATGRRLNTEGLNLEAAGIEVNDGRIRVNRSLRTTNKHVYSCGDVAGDFLFTHWAEYQAAVVIKNMLSPFGQKVDRSKIAWVTYTDPEVATFGQQARQLEQSGESFETVAIELKHVDRAICEGIDAGLLKLHLRKGTILGGTMIAKNGGELAGELIGAMTLKIPFSKLYNRIYPYPTMSRVNRRAVQKHLGAKLTPRNKHILKRLFTMFN